MESSSEYQTKVQQPAKVQSKDKITNAGTQPSLKSEHVSVKAIGQAMRIRPGGHVLTNSLSLDAHQPLPGDRASCPSARQRQRPSRNFHAAGFARPIHVCVLGQTNRELPWSSWTSLHIPHRPLSVPFSGLGSLLNTATPASSLQEEQHYQILAHH
jgi:hypothetical protein